MTQWLPENLRKYVPSKKLTIGLTLGALVIGGTAIAAQAGHSRADTNGDGVVTRAESQALATQRFALLDANKDGKLDPADRAARGTAMFSQIDADKNGQISQTEFDAARMQRMEARADGDGGKGGGRHDGGHEGRHHGGGRDGFQRGGFGHGQAMLMQADANKDGAISQAEFSAMTQQRFDAVDSDKNGQITTAERISARMTMRSMRQAPSAPVASPSPATPK